MAIAANNIFVEMDNQVQLSLTDYADAAVTGASGDLGVHADTALHPNAAAATDEGGGAVGIALTGHGLAVGDKIIIAGTINYDNKYTLQAGTTTDKLVITATYAAETFSGDEDIYEAMLNADNIALSDDGAGAYSCVIPDTVVLNEDTWYRIIIRMTKDTTTLFLNKRFQAKYYTGT